ncbi:MAG: hypothetical protein ACRETT_02770 [Steroidobacteraceae bacterium]
MVEPRPDIPRATGHAWAQQAAMQVNGSRGMKGDPLPAPPGRVSGENKNMQLARLWREHLQAGCPSALTGVEIAGSDARALDAEITACISAFLTQTLKVDDRIERRLSEISGALALKQTDADEDVATYCARLNQLVSAVLTESKSGDA